MVVSVIFATSAALGFVREIVMAGYFGASAQMDAFVVAMIIPTFFLNMLGEASMGAAVVPIFITYVMPQATQEQRRIVGSGFTLLALVLTGLAALGMLFAPSIAGILAPGFSESQLELTASLIRLLVPSIIVLGLSNFVIGLLHSFKQFGPAAMTGVAFNLAVVLTTIPLAETYGIYAPAIGVLVGCILQFLVMLPSLWRTGLFPSAGFSFTDPALVRMWRLFWPLLVGGLAVTALKSVDKIVGSFLPDGSISALQYASKLAGGPSRIFAMAISVVLFPNLAKKVADKSGGRGDMIVNGLNLAAFLTLPWTAMLIALATPAVYVVLQRGAFDAASTALVALPLVIYCLGDFADGISTMVNNAYYSHEDSRFPTVAFVGSNVFRVIAIFAFVPVMGYLGIATAQAIAVDGALIVLLLGLRRHVHDLDLRGLSVGFGKIVLASAVAGVVAWAAFSLLESYVAGSQAKTAAALVACAVPALAGYLGAANLLRCREVRLLRERLPVSLGGRPGGPA